MKKDQEISELFVNEFGQLITVKGESHELNVVGFVTTPFGTGYKCKLP